MKKVYFYGFLLISFYLLASMCFSQASPAAGSFLIHPWTVGQTVSYQVEYSINDTSVSTQTFSYSIIRQEIDNGNSYFWIEIEEIQPDGSILIKDMKVRQPEGIDFENILNNNFDVLNFSRLITEIEPSMPASLLPSPFVTPLPTPTPQCFEIQQSPQIINEVNNEPAPSETQDLTALFVVTPNESVTVNAGVFSVSEFASGSKNNGEQNSQKGEKKENELTDGWGTPQIPIWGIVKRISKNTNTDGTVFKVVMSLNSFSESGAQPKIVATPNYLTRDQERILEGPGVNP